jgi:hypothetical protein
MTFRESTGPIDTPWGSELKRIEKRIWDSDRDGIRARWDSGHHILKRRDGKQLPVGLLKHLCVSLEVSQRELSYRTQFAEMCPTETELSKTLAKFPTWNQIITHAFPKTRTRKAKPKPTAFHAMVVRCRRFKTRDDIPARDRADLRRLYRELQRLFSEGEK